jgi:hypothetical protein
MVPVIYSRNGVPMGAGQGHYPSPGNLGPTGAGRTNDRTAHGVFFASSFMARRYADPRFDDALSLFPRRSLCPCHVGYQGQRAWTVFPSRALHDKLRLKGAPQPRAIMCERSTTGGIILDDDSVTSPPRAAICCSASAARDSSLPASPHRVRNGPQPKARILSLPRTSVWPKLRRL